MHGCLGVPAVNRSGPRAGEGTSALELELSPQRRCCNSLSSPCQACDSLVKNKRVRRLKTCPHPTPPMQAAAEKPCASQSCPPPAPGSPPDAFKFSSSSVSGCASRDGGQNLCSCTHPLESILPTPQGSEVPARDPLSSPRPPQHRDAPCQRPPQPQALPWASWRGREALSDMPEVPQGSCGRAKNDPQA